MDRETFAETPAGTHPGWRHYLPLLALMVLGVVALFHETAWSMVSIWIRSETFAHGFLIVPIAAWLVMEKRRDLLALRPAPDLRVLLLGIPLGLGWLVANLVDVLVVQQFAFVGLLVVAIWAMLGNRTTRELAFPLGFLFFAVPVGEGLIPPMMDFTADFTVALLRMTDIPVYREGTFFSIPSGNWSVVEGCSGVRYLIASVTLGVLYAYLTYQRQWKRVLFILVAIVVPVIANGLRAYMIVMIAHLSDMKLALGVDHFIYGWVFFGIVVTVMFVIGAFWRDPPREPPTAEELAGTRAGAAGSASFVLVAGLVSLAVWPLVAGSLTQGPSAQAHAAAMDAPQARGQWRPLDAPQWDWEPHVMNPDLQSRAFFDEGAGPVGVYLSLYLSQRQDAELVNSQNVMVVQKHPVWSSKGQTRVAVRVGGRELEVDQSKIDSPYRKLLVWHWYRLGDRYTSNPYLAKILEAAGRLLGWRRDAALIAVAAPYRENPQEAVPLMQSFLDTMLPSLEAALDATALRGG